MSTSEEKMISVPASALYQLLQAVNGPLHLIRELQVITSDDNPIIVLTDVWNAYAESENKPKDKDV